MAVIVTYNRAQLLERTLAAVDQQSVRPTAIHVVNNASTDQTANLLSSRLETMNTLSVSHLANNTGGAGGFNHGMQRALELGADWIWVMDDDVTPDPDCLSELLRMTAVSECVHPRRIAVDDIDYGWEQYLDVGTGLRTQLGSRSFANGKDVIFTNVACFEGMLVSRRVVELIGLPDVNYFIGEDDTLFGVKASVHTNVALARRAVMRRLLPVAQASPWRSYYSVRNQYLLWRDANAYLGLRPGRVQTAIFHVARIVEALGLLRNGVSFFGPVYRGTRDGLRALRAEGRS